jgi:6-phosphogluconolactonase
MKKPEIFLFESRQPMFEAAAGMFLCCAKAKIIRNGVFNVAISGGSTPDGLFKILLTLDFNDWDKVRFFWVDERCTPPDSPDSNYGHAHEVFFSKAEIPADNINWIRGEAPNAANDYSELLKSELPLRDGIPVFDLVMLGMGSDGHTASLFPGSPFLDENQCHVVKVPPPTTAEPAIPRISITFPVINAADKVCFMITGQDKIDLMNYISNHYECEYPAAKVRPVSSSTEWFAAK